MRYTPRSRTRLCDGLVVGAFSAAVCAFCIASFMPSHGVVLQIVGLFLLTAAIYIAVRYALTTFSYSVSDGDFTVCRTQGRRLVTECRVSTDSIYSVSRFQRKRDIPRNDVSFYDYTASIGAKDLCFIISVCGEEKDLGIAIEVDDAFFAALSEIAKRNTVRGISRGEE